MTTLTQLSSTPPTVYSVSRGLLNDWLLGTNKGLWRIADDQFSQVAERLADVHITTAAHTTRGVLVGAADGLARSMDGTTWQQLDLPAPNMQISQLVITTAFRTIGIAFAATLDQGMLRSMDGGTTWAPCNLNLSDRAVVCMAASPAFHEDYNVFAALETGVYRGFKAGSQWQRLPLPEEALPPTCLTLTLRCIFVGCDAGLWRTDDGENWESMPDFAGEQVLALASSMDAKWLAVATSERIARSNTHGDSWEWLGAAPPNVISLAISDSGEIVAGTHQDGVWHTEGATSA